ncbi:putative Polyamine deacetylase HDAC10 [Blattamonas nauphoetae]|uniref:histone deacetylase n=1 Tax=Blattamonas nauphoetae TaxID=2049346 RepID=A0ABQ9XH11_9EUKA|nr:putative Polyamine deacetylase HDAC10 [Blattamonas nauphoetae]
MTTIWYNPICLQHRGEDPRFECPERLEAIISHLEASSLIKKCVVRAGHAATDDDILLCHSSEHLSRINSHQFSKDAPQFEYINRVNPVEATKEQLSKDSTYISQHSMEASRVSIGSCLEGVDMVLHGLRDGNSPNGFVLCRPPGHHSETNSAQGFCLFNNIAIAAQYAVNQLKQLFPDNPLKHRVLVFDWDVHHGNGTEEIFYHSPEVCYVSTHLFGDKRFYPYTGAIESIGSDIGRGYNVNIPFQTVNVGDSDFLRVIDEIIVPIANEFAPSVVLVSAGFDIMEGDSVGRLLVSPKGLHAMTSRLLTGIPCIQGRLLCVLEGGYSHNILAEGVCGVLQALLGDPFVPYDVLVNPDEEQVDLDDSLIGINPNVAKRVRASVDETIQKVKTHLSPYWSCFRDK